MNGKTCYRAASLTDRTARGRDASPLCAPELKECCNKLPAMNSSAACIIVLPHLERSPLVIEKCESLCSAHRVALFVPQAHKMRKCDFRITRSLSFFSVIALVPTGFAFRAILKLTHRTHLPLMLEASALRRYGTASTGNNSLLKSPSGESCFAASYASIRDARQLPPCLRSVPMQLSMRR